MSLPRLCVACGRRTEVGVRIVGDEQFVAARLAAIGLSKARAEKIARSSGGERKRLNVALCRHCARRLRSVTVGSPPPTIAQGEPQGVR